jgi:hypothetical protein
VAAKTWDKRRAFGDFLLSLCALAIVLGTLVAFDTRVREQVTMRMSGAQASTDIAVAQSHAHRLVAVIVSVAKEQMQDHFPLMIFVVAASALTMFMLRT